MKKTIATLLFCLAAIPAYAYPGGLAPGQTVASRPTMTPGATAVSNSGTLDATTAQTTMTATPMGTGAAARPPMTAFQFQRYRDKQTQSLQQHIDALQRRLQCMQMAIDQAALAACPH